MSNLSDFRESYYDLSGLASASARQLAFAGIAIIWIFKTGDANTFALPIQLQIPIAGFILALAADLMQYAVGSIIWGMFHRKSEVKYGGTPDVEIDAPAWLNIPALGFFVLKLVCVIVAYYHLFTFSLSSISFS